MQIERHGYRPIPSSGADSNGHLVDSSPRKRKRAAYSRITWIPIFPGRQAALRNQGRPRAAATLPYNGNVLLIRPATAEDAAVLARFRVLLFDEMGRLDEEAAVFAQAAENYFAWALSTGREAAWIAEVFGDPVGVLALTLESMPPKPRRHRLLEAYMHNVYVLPKQRQQGIAKRLVYAALDYARAEEIRRVRLYTSDDARWLYENLGFVPHTRYLELKP